MSERKHRNPAFHDVEMGESSALIGGGKFYNQEQLDAAVAAARAEEQASKDAAYHERDMLVCALSKLFPSSPADLPGRAEERSLAVNDQAAQLMKNPLWKKKPPARTPVILTVDQLTALLELHRFAGSFYSKGLHYTVCDCGAQLLGGSKELSRHIAVEIAKLQV
jgi:hypothetical protein